MELLKKFLSLLHSEDPAKQLFLANISSTIIKGNNNLKEILAPSKYRNLKKSRESALLAVTNMIFSKVI